MPALRLALRALVRLKPHVSRKNALKRVGTFNALQHISADNSGLLARARAYGAHGLLARYLHLPLREAFPHVETQDTEHLILYTFWKMPGKTKSNVVVAVVGREVVAAGRAQVERKIEPAAAAKCKAFISYIGWCLPDCC